MKWVSLARVSRWDEGAVRQVLEGVVSEELLAGYCRLVGFGEISPSEADELLGGADVTQALKDRGMVRRWSNPDRIAPSAPDMVLHAALMDLQHGLIENFQTLISGHRRLEETRRATSHAASVPEQLVQVVTDRAEITELSYSLIHLARHDWMTLENLLQEAPIDEDSCVAPLPAFEGKVRCRSIYEARMAAHPAGARILARAVEAGEEARLFPQISMKFKLADESAALLPLTPTGMGGALIIKAPAVVSALREYFELLWEKSALVGDTESENALGLSDVQRQVLQLLASGLQDEVIANRLKLSVHTVRRHITVMREMLGVESRFGMGAAAARRGWVA